MHATACIIGAWKIQHSPSISAKPKIANMCDNLPLGKGLGKNISHHIICMTIDKSDIIIGDDLLDEVVADVDMLCSGVVVVFAGKFDSSLVVTVKGGWRWWSRK